MNLKNVKIVGKTAEKIYKSLNVFSSTETGLIVLKAETGEVAKIKGEIGEKVIYIHDIIEGREIFPFMHAL